MKIENRRAVVLGGTSGIGLGVVQQLVDAGAKVTACGRSESNIETAKRSVNGPVSFHQLDVLDRDALAALFKTQAPLDILVKAATGGERAIGPFVDMDLDGFQRSFWSADHQRVGTVLV